MTPEPSSADLVYILLTHDLRGREATPESFSAVNVTQALHILRRTRMVRAVRFGRRGQRCWRLEPRNRQEWAQAILRIGDDELFLPAR